MNGGSTPEHLWKEETIYTSKINRNGKRGKALYTDENTNENVYVEEFAVRYFVRKGWNAVHSENSTFSGLVRY
jgi:hypothetical protein